jgi:anthranilate phosphoribosyltransferase
MCVTFSLPTINTLEAVFDAMLAGVLHDGEVKALLIGLADKGETGQEIAALVHSLQKVSVPIDYGMPVMDVCGTGGDGLNTLNISTAVAFVLAGCGVKVAKHGNRAASSHSGSSDVLSILQVAQAENPRMATAQLNMIGLTFLYAPAFHPALKPLAPLRKSLGRRTIINLAAPLANPIRPAWHLLGVGRASLGASIQEACSLLHHSAMIVHGMDGMDEVSVTQDTLYWTYCEQGSSNGVLPALYRWTLDDLMGKTPIYNAMRLKSLLQGKEKGAYYDAVCSNVATALWFSKKATDIQEGINMAKASLDSGAAYALLETLVQYTEYR